jgi:hypothetical protein
MFLFIKKQGCKIEIAEKPIVVWKIIHLDNLEDKIWRPLYFGTGLYRFNVEYEACEHLNLKDDGRIYDGFHAFRNPDKAVEERNRILGKLSDKNSIADRSNLRVIRSVIPGEAEYCQGENNQIVSSRIIVFKDDERLDNYLETWNTIVTREPKAVWLYVDRVYWDLFGCSWRLGFRCNKECDIKVKVYEKQQWSLNQIPMYAVIPEGTRYRKTGNEIETPKIIVFSGYKKFKKYISRH